MKKSCSQCQQNFTISPQDLEFYKRVSPVFGGKKYSIPAPQLCPSCRFQRRLLFRNDRNLYHRKSDLSGKQMISIYSSDKTFPVYDQAEWWSDDFDAKSYGCEVDFSKPFLQQVAELRLKVPRISLHTTNAENSYYTNHTLNCKNCYLLFGGGNNEDCLFANFISFSKNVVDGMSLFACELSYEGVASKHCYQCAYFVNCQNCTDCLMIEDCQSCQDCIGCFGLYRKQYYIFNQYVGKEAFETFKKELYPLTSEKIALLQRKLNELKQNLPHRASHIYASENCTGDMIFNSKNCLNCFDITDCEDSQYLHFTPKCIATQDASFTAPDGNRYCYNVCSTVGVTNGMSTFMAWYGANIYYSLECHHSNDLFGCVGLKNSQYCILNKQYSKEQYEALVPQIIEHMQKTGEWGEYFPKEMSPYGYNETCAQDYFSLTKEQAFTKGYPWKDSEEKEVYQGQKVQMPVTIEETDESICHTIFTCEITGMPYKILPQEFEFYRKMKLPIPRRCPDQRHRDRLSKRNPRFLWERSCAQCSAPIQTTYAPDRPEKVYCESCYLKDIY